MLLIFALIVAVLFVYLCRGLLKKYPYHFYAVAVLITVLVSFLNFKNAPVWFERCVVSLFSRGAFGTALFIIVMYTGALKNGTKRIAELMKVRGELSILAAIFVLAHNITYGKVYFKMLFTKPGNLPLNQMLAAIVSVFLITDMLVLTVLSFPQVRRKMRAVTWKRIQRTAYLFYACLYVHVLLIHLPLARKGAFYSRSVVMVYSVVFICYAVMRVRKYILMKYREKLENAKFKHCINAVGTFAGLAVFFAVVLAAFTGNNVTKTIAADTENVKTEAATEKTIASTKGTEKATEENSQNSETTENDTSDSGSDETAKAEEADGGVSDEQISDDSASEEKTTEEKTSNDSGASSANVSEATQAVTQKEEKTEAPRKFKADGTYTGSAVCDIYGYTVTASVTISGDSITALSIDTTASGLDMDYADKAVNGLKRKLVSNQGTSGVDAVSGATYSSNAIFRAFENAVN